MNLELKYLFNSWDVQSWYIDIIDVDVMKTIGNKDASTKFWLNIFAIKSIEIKDSTKKDMTWPDKLMIFFLFLWYRSSEEILFFMPSSWFQRV